MNLVVYYSRTGHTKAVAETISDMLACDIEEIVDTKKRSGVIGFLRSGREAREKELTVIKDIKKDVSHYDLVIIGTPVWGGSVSTPVRTFIHCYTDLIKRVAFFSTQGGVDAQNAFSEMEALCGTPSVSVLSITAKEVEEKEYTERVKEFVSALTTNKSSNEGYNDCLD